MVAIADQRNQNSASGAMYFETAGFRGIVADGWKAVAEHRPGDDFDDDHWALYRLADDADPKIVESLFEFYDRLAAELGSPGPGPRPAGPGSGSHAPVPAAVAGHPTAARGPAPAG